MRYAVVVTGWKRVICTGVQTVSGSVLRVRERFWQGGAWVERRVPWSMVSVKKSEKAKEAAQRIMARYEREMQKNREILGLMWPSVQSLLRSETHRSRMNLIRSVSRANQDSRA